jgi:hypothetical protein
LMASHQLASGKNSRRLCRELPLPRWPSDVQLHPDQPISGLSSPL